MSAPNDTHPDAARLQLELIRSFGPEKRRALSDALSNEMIRRSREHVARLHRLSPQAAIIEWVRGRYGPHVAARLLETDLTLGTEMTDIRQALDTALDAFRRVGVTCRVVGSMASAELGMARTTWDADVVAALEPRHVPALLAACGSAFYADEVLILEAIAARSSFNLIHLGTALKVDVFLPKDREYDRTALGRSNPTSPDFMTAEDVLLGKLEWYRAGDETSERQWTDILGILRVQAGAFDLDYARRWASEIGVADLLEKAIGES